MMLAEPMSSTALPDIQAASAELAKANAAHEAGRLDEAQAAYLAALQANPYSPEAEHGLAWLAVQRGDWRSALPRFKRAITLRPWEPEFWISQIEALFQLGQDEAVHRMLHRAGQSGLPAGRLAGFEARLHERRLDALARRVKASGRTPQNASQAPMAEVMALRELFLKRRFDEASATATDLVRRYPLCAFGWRVLGASQSASGSQEASLEALRIACDLDPGSADVRMNLALALHELGRLDEAEAAYRAVLAAQPSNVRALVNIGLLLNARHDPDAETMLREARRLGANDHRVALPLGGYLRDRENYDEAVGLLEEAIAADPQNPTGIAALSVCYLGLGRHEEAASLFRRLRDAGASHLGALDIALFVGSHIAEITPDELFALHRRYGEMVEASVVPHVFWDNDRDPDRKLRVGFVSGDLRRHAMASFLIPLWESLDRSRFEVFAYSNHRTSDEVTARLRSLADGWCDIIGMSDETAANRIRQDRIDVLVDLSGHTGFNRLGVFAFKPSPVQISWAGYPATTGLSRMDYYMLDTVYAPPGRLDEQFAERLLRVPANSSFMPEAESPPVHPLPSGSGAAFTFGSFNRMSKVTPATLDLWGRLMAEVPESRLLIGAIDPPNVERVLKHLGGIGIDPSRIEFMPRTGMKQYLDAHSRVDLLLDTYPYAGGTTTCHALWMGVPTLTLAGETLPSRTGVAIMGRLGLWSFVAENQDQFVALGRGWAHLSRRTELMALRDTLRERFLASDLGSPRLAIEGFEDGVRQTWRRWCRGEAPIPMVIPPRTA